MFVDPANDPRPVIPTVGDERTMLLAFLRWHRATLALKCGGLSPDELANRSVAPSTMSLLGLLRHVAEVERHWIRNTMAGAGVPPHFFSDAEPDGEFDGAVADAGVVADAWRTWESEVADSDAYLDATPDLDVVGSSPMEGTVSLRWVLVHLIEEYARHVGHADLLREGVDGEVGE